MGDYLPNSRATLKGGADESGLVFCWLVWQQEKKLICRRERKFVAGGRQKRFQHAQTDTARRDP